MKITVSPSTNDNRSIAEQLDIIARANREGSIIPLVLLAEQYIKNGDGDPASCYYFAQHDLENDKDRITRAREEAVPPKRWSKEAGWQVPVAQDAQDNDRDKIF